jgi:hypothetical protein
VEARHRTVNPGPQYCKKILCAVQHPLENKGETPHQPPLAPSGIHDTCQTDPDLAQINALWDRLPAAVKAGIVAMVKAAAEAGRGS